MQPFAIPALLRRQKRSTSTLSNTRDHVVAQGGEFSGRVSDSKEKRCICEATEATPVNSSEWVHSALLIKLIKLDEFDPK